MSAGWLSPTVFLYPPSFPPPFPGASIKIVLLRKMSAPGTKVPPFVSFYCRHNLTKPALREPPPSPPPPPSTIKDFEPFSVPAFFFPLCRHSAFSRPGAAHFHCNSHDPEIRHAVFPHGLTSSSFLSQKRNFLFLYLLASPPFLLSGSPSLFFFRAFMSAPPPY